MKCRYCGGDLFLFDKAPDGFVVNDAGQGWAMDESGDPVEDFICPVRESAARWPDGRPHEPAPKKYSKTVYIEIIADDEDDANEGLGDLLFPLMNDPGNNVTYVDLDGPIEELDSD